MFIYSCIFVVPVVATVYEDEVAADLGEVAVMSCMVAGEPIYNAYWKDVNHDRIYTSWHYEVTLVKGCAACEQQMPRPACTYAHSDWCL